jgi:phenylpropionate dioxygenase-like ring-hydroxylating dioxygenase large terminal subunit
MMSDQATLASVYEAGEREAKRTAYPQNFPTLPDMPSGRYHDAGFHALEMEHVFGKTWLSAAHVSELPKQGSYKLFEQFGLSIIVSRGTDDVIRAFRNVCRHRGAALVTEPTGTAKRFICPYHAWGYASDGTLKSVPEAQNFACLDKADKPLFQVRCETWRGFVFINLDQDAEPLADFLAPWAKQAGSFPFEEMSVKNVITVELDCNWKTAYDNFLEIYHVSTVHARTIAPFLDSKSFVITLLKNGHGRFTTRKRQQASLFNKEEGDASSLDGLFKDHTVALPRFPNGFTALDPAGFNWMTFWPAGPHKMLMVSTLMGKTMGDAEADIAYWKDFSDFQVAILNEDVDLFPSIQRSMETGELPALVLSYQEQYLHWYNEEIDRKIGRDNIPAHLRVSPVLEHLAID